MDAVKTAAHASEEEVPVLDIDGEDSTIETDLCHEAIGSETM